MFMLRRHEGLKSTTTDCKWEQLMTMPTKAQIFEHWMDWLDKIGFNWGTVLLGLQM